MKEKVNTGIYIRVSTEDQVNDGFSIHAQKEKLTKYADVNDWIIIDYYIDNGISGKNLEDRPEMTRLLKDVEKGKINNILIYKLDRLTRSMKDLIYLIDFFEENNCTFNSQTEKIDTSNAVGRMFVKIIGIFAEFERENLAERVALGYEQKTREGNYTNTNGVYGYDYIAGKKRLIVNENEKKLVNRIFDLYIDGKSYFKIAKLFNDENIPTKRGGHWAAATIKSIITNPLYIGKIRYSVKNKSKFFVVDGNNIDSIVKEDKWKLANNISKQRSEQGIRRYPSDNSYFFHVVRCDNCGSYILARQQIYKEKLYVSYICSKSNNVYCNCKSFSHKSMEKAFINYLSKMDNINFNNQDYIKKYYDEQSKLDIKKVDILRFYEKIGNINLKVNWLYLTNKEKKQFLERFVKEIRIEKLSNRLFIKSVEFKK